MKAGYELTAIFLRVWLLGFIVVVIASISDVAFRRPRSFSRFWHQIWFGFIWPLAILSDKGRRLFFWY